MSQTNRCSKCGADLSSGASPEGYCPKCLLAFALDDSESGLTGAGADADPSQPATRTTDDPVPSSPNQIGPFRILEKLGEGGMGEVFLAEQLEPVRRRVALKLIKPGMDSKQVLARFESERQALALMDHPSIAKVFDGGTTDQGRPYFAMEYIEGEPITRYCDRHRLDTQARLELFMQVCEGVQHAHQKGIIHRDIKPSNVLVTVRGKEAVPRIIDFGVAKATHQRLTERTMFTRLGVLIGTPEYMSPEQAEMTSLDIDTRTDVYSLGVLLYELLVGALPFDSEQLRQAGFDEIRRRIREDEPSKPSTRISTLEGDASINAAQRRGVDPTTLRRQLRGDLDWITMRALEKDRTRRYGSPADLALDVRRHLAHEPVLAGPPSVGYRTKKFVRRHRVGVGVASVALIVLIAFAATMTFQARRIARERDRANREAETSSRIAEFMTGLFNESDPYRKKGEKVTVEQMLHRAADRIESELADEPEIQGPLLHTMGTAFYGIGKFTRAEQLLSAAATLLRSTHGEMHADTLRNDWRLAITYRRLGRLDEAETLIRSTLAKQRQILGEEHFDTLITWNALGNLEWRRGNFARAAEIFEMVLAKARLTIGPEHPRVLVVMHNLAHMYTLLDRLIEGETLVRAANEIQKRIEGQNHPRTLEGMHILGHNLEKQGRLEEAERILEEAADRLSQVFDEDNLYRISTGEDLAMVYLSQERYAEAEAGLRKSYEAYRRTLGERHARTIGAQHRIALALLRSGRPKEAEKLELRALDDHRGIASDEHPTTVEMVETMADILNAMGDSEGARPYVEELIEARRRQAARAGASPRSKASFAKLLLSCEPSDLRDPQTALRVAHEAAELSDAPGPEVLHTLALAHESTGDVRNAVDYQRRAIEALPDGSSRQRATMEAELERFLLQLSRNES